MNRRIFFAGMSPKIPRRGGAGAAVAVAALLASFTLRAGAQARPGMPERDRTRLREAERIARAMGDSVWPGWHAAPFGILLVTPETEYLVGHPARDDGFEPLDGDTLLGAPVFARKRVFAPAMQATFPAVGGINTVVIGEAELTSDKTSSRWLLTVMHEHFHQLVYSQPGYFAAVDSLGLAHGDQTGMWMLNYPFPYDSARVQSAFSAMTRALAVAVSAADGPDLLAKAREFRRAKIAFYAAVPTEAASYFEFQLWQEGVARYTEIALGERVSRAYEPSAEFAALPDYQSLGEVTARVRSKVLDDLLTLSLAKSRREVVYSTGAAEAMLLDRVRPEWKRDYFTHRFQLPDPR